MKKKTIIVLIICLAVVIIISCFFCIRKVNYNYGREQGYLIGCSFGYIDGCEMESQNSQELAGSISPFAFGSSKWKGFMIGFSEGYSNGYAESRAQEAVTGEEREGESIIQPSAANDVVGGDTCPAITIAGVTYYDTGKAVPVEPDDSIIVYEELPIQGGLSTGRISAYAFINGEDEDSKEVLACLINGGWYEFAARAD